MSKKSASQFLADATESFTTREKFASANSPEEFIEIAESEGYDFTIEELEDVVHENSEGVTLRRKTGVWQWLRNVHWLKR